MKKIVTVQRHIDGRTRIYEVPEDMEVHRGDNITVEFKGSETAAVATQDAIEVADDIVAYFTNRPLRKVTEADEF